MVWGMFLSPLSLSLAASKGDVVDRWRQVLSQFYLAVTARRRHRAKQRANNAPVASATANTFFLPTPTLAPFQDI
ncbi:hypothetical protein BV25DRAFT_1819978 [Artomyces pyxidatus]|uniref:Uncharacterized protein n=1 Tax=Artomyces pyxidatus TaxID=48021 RepID=A0ACB8TEM8_9AGAM|nr:hypothetical protein BV25DRAFT_1819978 [Artomyces pyxidatus]